MDKFMMMPKGFMGLPMEEEFISTAENKKNTQKRLEIKKFCKTCKIMTLHKETK